ncbi:zinc ribbon domain-containing protein [Vibrio sp. Of7-15]|uniref:zinc ribbon domain-containing protein n=1 Tax=Vibrio sp. Of7-15 TaxID=2724879 RepID=UPI001EF2757C|nr:zinc ribbon domain-containing protein [Vibrio sp. Of7-15]MCG7498613.1 zinc ribbon domain-containing protein [Vibrio sp. Of7-15]
MNTCPSCESELRWQQDHYHCDFCQVEFKKIAFCPDCDKVLDKLQACGSASYFCNECNELKSKSRVKVEFQPSESA